MAHLCRRLNGSLQRFGELPWGAPGRLSVEGLRSPPFHIALALLAPTATRHNAQAATDPLIQQENDIWARYTSQRAGWRMSAASCVAPASSARSAAVLPA